MTADPYPFLAVSSIELAKNLNIDVPSCPCNLCPLCPRAHKVEFRSAVERSSAHDRDPRNEF